MRMLLQRVLKASVSINGHCEANIGKGLCIFLGITQSDGLADALWLATKAVQMRIFNDNEDKMNLSVNDVAGEILVVSQFTLYAQTKKGNRPSFIASAAPDVALPLYKYFINQLQLQTLKTVQSGVFGANMNIEITNQGPVTIWVDSLNKA